MSAIVLAVQVLSNSLHCLDDLFITRFGLPTALGRLGRQAAKLRRVPLSPQSVKGGEVLQAHDGNERLSLLLDDDRLARVADAVG